MPVPFEKVSAFVSAVALWQDGNESPEDVLKHAKDVLYVFTDDPLIFFMKPVESIKAQMDQARLDGAKELYEHLEKALPLAKKMAAQKIVWRVTGTEPSIEERQLRGSLLTVVK